MGSARDRAHARAEILAETERRGEKGRKKEKRLTTESNLGPLTLKAQSTLQAGFETFLA